MDQHPIPQDVTGFQFKLIGTMTVKQFGYIAVGAILAAVCWYLPVQGILLFITRGIFVPFFGLSGVIIAFVPIEGRPVDVMTKNLFHALMSPNQYLYIKKGRKFSFTQISYTKKVDAAAKNTKKVVKTAITHTENKKEEQLRAFLAHTQGYKNNLDKKEAALINIMTTMPQPSLNPLPSQNIPSAIIPISPSMASIPSPVALQKNESIPTQPNQNIKAKTPPVPTPPETKIPSQNQQQETIQKNPNEENTSHQKMLELQKQIQDTHTQKEQLEQELLKLKNQLSSQKTAISPALLTAPTPLQDIDHVRSIPQNMTKTAGLSKVSDTPNVIVGIVKDARNNILPNILVEVKDKDGNPVRAFKTNPLGQFVSATPLANGIYTIELEDPKKQHAFDTIQINASGQIILPIEIISHDAREELHKALFS